MEDGITPPMGGMVRDSGLDEVEVYIVLYQSTATQYIEMQLILGLYMEAERRSGAQVYKW